MSSNVEKFRRTIKAPGMIVTGTLSVAALDINSFGTFDDINVSGVSSVGTLDVSSTITGNAAFRGFASMATSDVAITVSATAVASGIPVLLTAQASLGGTWVDSVVDNTSFMIVANDAVPAATNVSWFIIK